MIEITQPGLEDLPPLVALKREALALHVAHAGWLFVDPGDAALTSLLHSRLADAAAPLFVARRKGEVVGFAAASVRVRPATPLSRECRALYLEEICVRSDCRRMGIGRRLVDAVVTAARDRGLASVELDAWAFNAPAARFFTQLGFQPQLQRLSLRWRDS